MRMQLAVPKDYLLARDLCSYGYFLLEPNHWDPRRRSLVTTLDLPAGATTFRILQGRPPKAAEIAEVRTGAQYDPDEPGPGKPGQALNVTADRELGKVDAELAKGMLARILRLDESADALAEFHVVDPRFARCGRGRLMRSATIFEDVVKTVTSCNVTWPGTVGMNRRLCNILGRKSPSGLHAFPTAARLARARPATLRARCGVGYRDSRLVELSKMFAAKRRGVGVMQWVENATLSDEQLFRDLVDLPGIGPYAAANILQLLGRYDRLPLDTESVRHGKTVLGMTGSSSQIMKRLTKHYEPFGPHKFRSYWFELWRFYEAKRGHAWTWERETTGKSFTAALLE